MSDGHTTSAPRLGMLAGDRRNNFDVLRLAAAVLVIFGHSFAITSGTIANEPLWRFSNQTFHSGTFAVRVFFVISGFLITASYDRVRRLDVFVANRFLRIFPGLLAAVLVTMAVIGPIATTLPLSAYFKDPQTYAYLKTLTLRLHAPNDRLPGVFTSNPLAVSVNGSLWTLFYEVACYAVVGVLGALGLLRKPFVLLAFFGAMAIRPIIVHLDPASTLLGGESLFLGQAFMAGSVCYLFRDQIPISGRLFAIAVIGLTVGTSLGLGNQVFPFLGTYAILILAYHPAIRLHDVARRGDFSYGMYIYAFPVQQMIVRAADQPMSPALNFLRALPVTLMLAVLSWHVIERRFMRLKVRTSVPG